MIRVHGPGVRGFFEGEHGCHIRESTTAGTEIVRVRVLAATLSPAEHLDHVRAERAAFVRALEHADPAFALPPHPDAILAAVRRYRFDPIAGGTLTDIVVEDFPLLHSTETRVRRLADVLPTLWLLRMGAEVPSALDLVPDSDGGPDGA